MSVNNPSEEELKQIISPTPSGGPTQQQPPHSPAAALHPQQQQQQTPPPGAGKARLQCHACHRLLEYDAGAQYVQCFSCSTMNAVQPGTQLGGRVLSMLCAICHTTNLAPYGINYVRCGSCSTISQVTHAYRQQQVQLVAGQPSSNGQEQQQQAGSVHDISPQQHAAPADFNPQQQQPSYEEQAAAHHAQQLQLAEESNAGQQSMNPAQHQ